METMFDTWLWTEQMNGDLIDMPGMEVTPTTDVEAWAQRIFERYDRAVLVRLWQQVETTHGPTNVCLKEWARAPQYGREEPSKQNPLGLFCSECGLYCRYDETKKRWLCDYGHA